MTGKPWWSLRDIAIPDVPDLIYVYSVNLDGEPTRQGQAHVYVASTGELIPVMAAKDCRSALGKVAAGRAV